MAIRFMDPKGAEDIRNYVNGDAEFKLAATHMMTNVQLQVGDARCVIKVREGKVSEILANPVFAQACSFYVKGSEDAWAKFLQPVPPPFYNGVFSAMIRQNFELGGDLEEAFSDFWPLTRMLDLFREVQNR
jgi:hypothetical protein